ncbi:tellurite resistance/C4-dicarboxylate transporter family protein [Candidatus Sumerlaeota bacterium]|nr:tellurite resistance/C4-dicarboxylate transporter family protein [Candidatus Sumerlaeota bacterium]
MASVENLKNLNPANFALVMATGIISIAAHHQGFDLISAVLFDFSVVAYVILWVLYVGRAVYYPGRFWGDFRDHIQGMGFFTSVAATGVLGCEVRLLTEYHSVAVALWCVAVFLWISLIYGVFTGLITKESKPSIADGINGGWLLAIVATQAVAVLSTGISPFHAEYRESLLFFAFVTWLFGGMFYIWILSLIFYRYMFFQFSPKDLTPPYWINMGAVAITTLGGAELIANAASSRFLAELTPFLKGFTFFFWATATWWIPMLVILGVWRHGLQRIPVQYSPLFWGAVFPLGMYTVCTYRLAETTSAPVISAILGVFIYLAIGGWALAFVGLVKSIAANICRPHQQSAS